mmetsp:Transcript_29812/g.45193  ORF Transcript_29812/g.45193 Transcript_29812/m.45193 type:complete len:248 (-) Transcript_29812:1615-2358(-)
MVLVLLRIGQRKKYDLVAFLGPMLEQMIAAAVEDVVPGTVDLKVLELLPALFDSNSMIDSCLMVHTDIDYTSVFAVADDFEQPVAGVAVSILVIKFSAFLLEEQAQRAFHSFCLQTSSPAQLGHRHMLVSEYLYHSKRHSLLQAVAQELVPQDDELASFLSEPSLHLWTVIHRHPEINQHHCLLRGLFLHPFVDPSHSYCSYSYPQRKLQEMHKNHFYPLIPCFLLELSFPFCSDSLDWLNLPHSYW